MMEKKVVDQKEYLKKYLSSGHGDDKKKKKKKKPKIGQQTVKVIDDDINLMNMRPVEDNEFDILIGGEDAPQIAGIVDERGPVDFSDKRRWKIVANDEGGDLTITSTDKEMKSLQETAIDSENNLSLTGRQRQLSDDDLSPPRIHKKSKNATNRKPRKDDDSDLSPPRIKDKKQMYSKYKAVQDNSDGDGGQDADLLPLKSKRKDRRKERMSDDSDLSPPRKSKKHKAEKHKKNRNKDDSDLSPPRKSKKGSDSDLSPPRRAKDIDSDLSPPRKSKKNYDSDLSPPRKWKNKYDDLEHSSLKKSENHRHRKRDSDSDLSPPRRKNEKNIHSSSRHKSRNYEPQMSPPRQNKKYKESYSDTRRGKHKDERMEGYKVHKYSDKSSRLDNRYYNEDVSPSRKKHRDLNASLDRSNRDDRDMYKSKTNKFNDRYHRGSEHSHSKQEYYSKENRTRHRDIDDEAHEKRMSKTLDGKKAGLQDAKALREETEAHKIREAEQFSKLSKEVTGVGQAVIVRDIRTGRKRNLEAEAAEEREKQKRQAELDEKYAKWGKGLKQVEDRQEKLKDDMYEMSKPLARYADDADLDKRLRDQEREGDPMLEYIKQKQIKEGKRKPDPPRYGGSFMPNRFGIKPGYRWDGVDRSNGYEKRWFEAQNAKVALQEEAYKWSTSDM